MADRGAIMSSNVPKISKPKDNQKNKEMEKLDEENDKSNDEDEIGKLI